MPTTDRRTFLRLLGLAGLAACSPGTDQVTPTPTGSPTPTTPAPTSPAPTPTRKPGLRWRVIEGPGPAARRDHSLTAVGDRLYLFGGRGPDGERFDDLWELDPGTWTLRRLGARGGPSKRLGHNAASVGGRLLIFGGQDDATTFFNDLWAYDPAAGTWERLARGDGPEVRYGGGGAVAGSRFFITHGFRSGGRFEDTWLWNGRWRERTPAGAKPVKRCLIATPYLASAGAIVLYGGQTDGTPFLGDTWLYDVAGRSWRELDGRAPSPRNVYAAASTAERMYLFGGETSDGPSDELWTFDGRSWTLLDPAGNGPRARGGVAGDVLGDEMFVFGGRDGDTFFDNTWRLTLPA